ncbi:hypothetical protein QTI33_08875 [Variovorax sp. J22P271]|uniref:hypothetical protein n=1 Tax=Variovorax davisae TaxID=3053515 RepID=UPI00257508FD|nr:hypothetical protein [Variovorax sp. J22P271]MDM0032242.1 hypothetical protein [Variovorax sp. J22P271]
MGLTIVTLNDLSQLPDSELVACFAGIRSAIREAKRTHADAQALARRQSSRLGPRPRPEMPIEELGLRLSISSALKEIGIYYLEDFSEAREDEVLEHEAIGVRTTARIRDVLQQASLSFRDPQDAEKRTGAMLHNWTSSSASERRTKPETYVRRKVSDEAIRYVRGQPQTPCVEALAKIFLGAHYELPFLLNQCRVIVEATLPGLTMSLVRELAECGQQEWLREIAEEMRRDFPTIWTAGLASKAEQSPTFSTAKSRTRGAAICFSQPLH